MSVTNGISRFSRDQCCGTAVIRLVSTITGVFCLVSSDCDDGCEPSSFAVDCASFIGLEDGDEIEVYCRPDCGYSGELPPYVDPCDGGGGGGCPDECPGGSTGCETPTCTWTWIAFISDWVASSCPEDDVEGDCTCRCKPTDPGDFNGETSPGLCCK